MFTGIIKSIGTIENIETKDGDKRFTINVGTLRVSDINLGDSIAVNGVCLTVIALTKHCFIADVSIETLQNSSLPIMQINSNINLEQSLTPSSFMGGHIVTGHVDGLAEVTSIRSSARSMIYWFKLPKETSKYVVPKGSITIDGVSLTVNLTDKDSFTVNIVPFTKDETIFKTYKVGTKVNIEVDILSRYIERLLHQNCADSLPHSKTIISENFLQQHGYK